MKRIIVYLSIVSTIVLSGCAQNHFNIPTENFAEKVKVLGVAPIFIDTDSDISYPQKELLIPLISDLNRKYEPLLVRKLQSTGNFYAVTPLADEPRQLFSSLMSRREKRDDASIQYNKYFWKNEEIISYLKKKRLDAVMVVVVSGLTKTGKIYSSNLLTSLETDFNFLTMTAQIIGTDGTILWEFPNFRGRLLTYSPLVNLQYPDFSESEANLSNKTTVRFKSIEGIRRTLEQKRNDWLLRETQEPEIYGRLFDEMTALIKHDGNKLIKETAADDKQLPKESVPEPVPVPTQTTLPTPAVKAPAQAPAANKPGVIPGTPSTSPNEIVPATESAR